MDAVTFAATRRERLTTADDEMRSLVKEALGMYPGSGWTEPIVTGAAVLWLEIFTDTAPEAYPDSVMRDFRKKLAAALEETKSADPDDTAQVERITRWVGTYAVGSADYHATAANGHPQMRWIDMGDSDVRPMHQAVNGQTVRAGGTFLVGGVRMHHPGEPVGSPEHYLNCRCIIQPVGKGRAMSSSNTAFVAEVDDVVEAPVEEAFEDRTGVVIVALPAADDPVVAASSEDIAHMTLVWLGDAADLPSHNVDVEALKSNLSQWAARVEGPITEGVAGSAVLGADKADVVLIDAHAMVELRNGMVSEFAEYPEGRLPEEGEDEQMPISRVFSETEQFPVWTPHVTLGYPGTPALAEFAGTEVTFDRFALWVGDERFEFPFGGAEPDAIVAAAVETEADLEEEDDDVDEMLPIPVHGIAAPIGVPTGDGRQLAPGGFSHRTLPLPLAWQEQGVHGSNVLAPTYVVGVLTKLWEDEEDGVPVIRFQGEVHPTAEKADAFIQAVVDGRARSVSIDLGDLTIQVPDVVEYTTEEEALAAMVNPPVRIMATWEVAGLTAVPVGAFREAYLALGECDCIDEVAGHEEVLDEDIEADDEDIAMVASALGVTVEDVQAAFAPGTKDGPGWITNPRDTARIRRYWVRGKGAAKIKWGVPGDFNRCRRQLAKYITNPEWLAGACANMHKEALGVWPGRENGSHALVAGAQEMELDPHGGFALVASAAAPDIPPTDWFRNPKLQGPTPFTVTSDGRVYGHLATWGTCHIGIQNVCSTPPFSATSYAIFKTGLVETTEGPVAVGQLTFDTGHASVQRSVGVAAAAAHYDNTGSAFADVAAGEDAHGIWIAGALRQDLTTDELKTIRAAALSGDWRKYQGNYELVGILAVNIPGYPIPRPTMSIVDGEQVALVASGIVTEESIAAYELELAREVRRQRLDALRSTTAGTMFRHERISLARRHVPQEA